MSKKDKGLTPIGDLLKPVMRDLKRSVPTPIQQRLIDVAVANVEQPDARSVLYQHSVFCQAFFPYRDPGDATTTWDRTNGMVDLRLKAGEAKHPNGAWVQVPLPFGPKCRLVLMHINQLAIVNQSPHIEMEDSLTGFVRRILKLDPKGRNIAMVKEQLRRLATSSIRLGMSSPDGTSAVTRKLDIVNEFDVWFAKHENQRVLWPSYVDLSPDYFNSLLQHAVPLDEHHIGGLTHSGMALDIYVWLAQRLHRIAPGKPVFVSWAALHGQFGQGYNPDRMDRFRQVFKAALKQVCAVYQSARITEDERKHPQLVLHEGIAAWRQPPAKGLTLHHSHPPIPGRSILVRGKA